MNILALITPKNWESNWRLNTDVSTLWVNLRLHSLNCLTQLISLIFHLGIGWGKRQITWLQSSKLTIWRWIAITLNWINTYIIATSVNFIRHYVLVNYLLREFRLWLLEHQDIEEPSLGVGIALNAWASALLDLTDLKNEWNNDSLDWGTGGGGAGHSLELRDKPKFSWLEARSARARALCLVIRIKPSLPTLKNKIGTYSKTWGQQNATKTLTENPTLKLAHCSDKKH